MKKQEKNIQAFISAFILFVLFLILSAGCTTVNLRTAEMERGGPPSLSVQDFVSTRFVDRWPLEEALKYDVNDVPPLSAMLSENSQSHHWGNILGTLGLIGGKDALGVILNFLSRPEIPTHNHETIARMSALRALGFWVWVSENLRHPGYSGSKASPDDVIERLIDFIERSQNGATHAGGIVSIPVSTEPTRKRLMTNSAVWGLGQSGNSQAKKALEDLVNATSKPSLRDHAAEALKLHEDIQEVGLLCHYAERQSQICSKKESTRLGILERILDWVKELFSPREHK